MSAFSRKVASAVEAAISELKQRELFWADELRLTPDDILGAIASPSDAEALKRAGELTLRRGVQLNHEKHVSVGGDGFYLKVYGVRWVSPNNWVLEAGTHVSDEIVRHVGVTKDIKAKWSRISFAMGELDRNCETLAQVRFFMPAIVALLRMREETNGIADRLTDFKVPRSIPRVSDGVRDICRSASADVAQAMFYAPVPPGGRRVTIM